MHCSISGKEVCQRSIVEKGTKLGTRSIQVTMEAISVRKFGEELLIPTIITLDGEKNKYRSGTLNSNTVNSKFHLIRSFFHFMFKNNG